MILLDTMSDSNYYYTRLQSSIELTQNWISKESNCVTMRALEDDIYQTLMNTGTVYFFGNGGSAAEASHFAAEFVGKCLIDVGPQSSICLNDSVAAMSAVANDWHFEDVFVRQVRAHCKSGDLTIGLTTSGSRNVIRALQSADSQGCRTWLFTSDKFTEISEYQGNAIVANTTVTSIAQELHLQIGHAIIESLELRVNKSRD